MQDYKSFGLDNKLENLEEYRFDTGKNVFKIILDLFTDKKTFLGMILVLSICLIAIFAPVIAPNDPLLVDVTKSLQGSSSQFWLGTDNLGRCEASRLIWGARASLTYAIEILSITVCIGVIIGLISGYIGGTVDHVIMAITNVFMSFPSVVLALAIAGILGPSNRNLIIAMSCISWTSYARIVRGLVIEYKEKDFILVAYATGCSHFKVVIHILKNIISPIVILATLEVGNIILAIAGYSFIGLGSQPPAPEWGVMLNDSKTYLQTQPQLLVYPGIAIAITVMAFNLLGEGLKDKFSGGNYE